MQLTMVYLLLPNKFKTIVDLTTRKTAHEEKRPIIVNTDKDGGIHHTSYKYQTMKIYETESQLKPARWNTN